MRLIDADSLICELQESKQNAFGAGWQRQIQIYDALIDLLNEAPTIDIDRHGRRSQIDERSVLNS